MIGLKMLHQIDVRLRAIMARPTVFFGGMNILLCGNFAQLPPVLDTALYALPAAAKVSVEIMTGKKAYDAFTETVALTGVMRQQGDSSSARQFCQTLAEIRDGSVSRENWQFLLARASENLGVQERFDFGKALRLYGTKKQTAAYNLSRLEHLARPVLKVKAVNREKGAKGAKDASADDAGLENELLLSKGSRVMITRNLWTSGGGLSMGPWGQFLT